MDSQQKIVEFLAKPENLATALEVAKHIDELRQHLRKSFWNELIHELENHLTLSKYKDKWNIFEGSKFEDDYPSYYFRVRNKPGSFTGSTLTVTFEQNSQREGFQFYYGLVWWDDVRDTPSSSAYENMLEQSIDNGFSDKFQKYGWVTRKYLEPSLKNDDFALQYCLDRTEFIDSRVTQIWDYFESIEPELYKLNQELFEGK